MSESQSVETKYRELHNQFRDAVNVYLKGSTMALAIMAFALGYVFKVPLDSFMSRTVSAVVLLILSFWYLCSFWALRAYSSVVGSIKDTSQRLGLSFEPDNYRWFKVVIVSAMCCVVFLVLVFGYLLIWPPAVRGIHE